MQMPYNAFFDMSLSRNQRMAPPKKAVTDTIQCSGKAGLRGAART
jgi:hypothetical protein